MRDYKRSTRSRCKRCTCKRLCKLILTSCISASLSTSCSTSSTISASTPTFRRYMLNHHSSFRVLYRCNRNAVPLPIVYIYVSYKSVQIQRLRALSRYLILVGLGNGRIRKNVARYHYSVPMYKHGL
jgi:hypothetical protein